MTEKTFILGLGNQKCGTSWLHKYLEHSPNFDGGITKEYHIWDALDMPTERARRLGLKAGWIGTELERVRYRMHKSPKFYFRYFDGLLTGDTTITADITPSYCGLSKNRLSFIRDNLTRRGITVKPVILLRDPVRRIKSAVRFNLDRKNYAIGIEPREADFIRALTQYYRLDHCRVRTSYQNGLSAAREVFGDDNLYVGIYETMFEPENIDALSRFLGIEPDADFANVPVNKTRGKPDQSQELELEMRAFYSDVYDYCFENYPETKRVWDQASA